jgi:hypothetical protein
MNKIYADGEVIGGKLKLKNSAKFIADVAGLKGEVRITVGKKERPRSIPQNNYYWGVVIKMIADFVGENEPENIHEAMGLRFAGVPAGDGKLGRALLVRKSTSDMNTFEFEEYMEKIRNFAAMELQLTIPLPNEVQDFEL